MSFISINKKPIDSDTHTCLDFMELLCLVNMDGVSTVDTAIDRFFDSPGAGRGDDDVEEAEDMDEEASDRDEGRAPVVNRRRALVTRLRRRFSDAISLASWRNSEYGDSYPFTLDASNSMLSLKAELRELNYVYLFLLISANLAFVKERANDITNEFERMSMVAFSSVMPAGSQVHIFGKANASRYSGSAYNKLASLCADIRASLSVAEEDYRPNDSGDSGIDLVAWHGMGDMQSHIVVGLGQCACSRSNWTNKQLAASPQNLHYVNSPASWKTFMFVPICFRRIGGQWAVATEIASVIFLDRLRLIKGIENSGIGSFPFAENLVREVMASESIV
ncbi:hypothetical protein [Xanthomonas floridensis]|uniref:Fungal lipase-like domain-containing protein n=1 Tax=Xanthomonas floridensis TaxID=1843580 RepID=A0ABU5Q412_9XANT|nr:hypothetical protein [Xanthomonas floridensis]MEA5126452.1 hypothetical protein [Xanthomonas floridensis]MEA5134425.1 hypothetical protein [Xanthomonas floridensis]